MNSKTASSLPATYSMAVVHNDVLASETLNWLHRFSTYPVCVKTAREPGLVAGHHQSQSSKRQNVDTEQYPRC